MRSSLSSILRFFGELKRRNVYQVAVTYAIVGFVLIQVADLTFVRLGLPPWTVTLVITLIGLGFPIALVMAWALEVTPEGVRVEEPAGNASWGSEEPSASGNGSRVPWIAASVLACLLLGAWWLWEGPQGGETADAARDRRAEVNDRSVAVLPFEALGKDEPDTFTEGMHADLQTKLANVAGLTVTSSRSVERYRGSDESTAAIARELEVGWIVSGDVQRMGNHIQANVRLVEPETDTQAWTEGYRRDLTAENLFAIQADITKKVAQALKARLSPAERDRVERQPTDSLEAHRLYSQGRRLMLSRQPDSLERAIRRFERAIEQDSSYALAWAGLADARILLASYSAGESPSSWSGSMATALPEAERAARRALSLDPELAEAHASIGNLHTMQQLLPEKQSYGPAALRHLRRAVDLKPSYGQAQHWLGMVLKLLGRPEHGLEHLRLAVELSPDNRAAHWEFVNGLLANGKYEEAVKKTRRLKEIFPNDQSFAMQEITALIHLRRIAQARSLIQDRRAEAGDSANWPVVALALADAAAGDMVAARNRLERMHSTEGSGSFEAALIYAMIGETDFAFEMLPRIRNFHYYYFDSLRYLYPDLLSGFRKDARYEKLIRRVNEHLGLNADGSLPDSANVSFAHETRKQRDT